MNFSTKITSWYLQNKRDLPWRDSTDSYRIWLSEIILQQTRIDQGLDYYRRFVERFPTVAVLAEAAEEEVLKLWQGLGYYTRARNLHKTARIVTDQYGGMFPDTWDALIALPGVGEYTAAAILSMAHGKAYPVVDGNVYRVLSRVFGLETPIDSGAGKKEFRDKAAELLDSRDPGTYNQAVMEFGALFCTPQNPGCKSCIFKSECTGFLKNKVKDLPVKKSRQKQRTRYFYYIFFRIRGNVSDFFLINKREGKDIWANLYDFPLIESDKPLTLNQIKKIGLPGIPLINIQVKTMGNEYKHILSHQVILARFIRVEIRERKFAELQKNIRNEQFIAVPPGDLIRYPVPRLIDRFLEKYGMDKSSDDQ